MKHDLPPQLILPIVFVIVSGFLCIVMTFVPIIYFIINKSPDIGGVMAIAIGVFIFLPIFLVSIIFLIKTIEERKK